MVFSIALLMSPYSLYADNSKLNKVLLELKSSDVKTRKAAISDYEVLERNIALEYIECLVPLLKDYKVKEDCVRMIGHLFIPPQAIRGVYITRTFGIERIEPNVNYRNASEKIIPYLIPLLSDQDEDVREATAETLCYIGSPARKALTQLKDMLNDRVAYVRHNALLAIVNIEPCGIGVLTISKQMLNDDSETVRKLANEAIQYLSSIKCN